MAKLRLRTETVTGNTLDELSTAGHIPDVGDVDVTIRAECGHCGQYHEIDRVIYGVCPCRE